MATEEVNAESVTAKFASQFVRDEILSVIRGELPKPWQQMTEFEQQRVVNRVENIAHGTVRKTVEAIAAFGRNVVIATMGPLSTEKKGVPSVKVTFQSGLEDDDKLAIFDHIGRNIHVVLMDAQEYTHIKDKAHVQKDEPELPISEEKQPDWDAVAEAVPEEAAPVFEEDASGPPPMPDSAKPYKYKPEEGEDAGVIEEEEAPPAPARAKGADDLLDDEMDAAEVAKIVNIENPATKPAPIPPQRVPKPARQTAKG